MCTSEDIADYLHGESLLCNLNEQRMQGFLCDVTIVVEDTKFKAHRNILAASSLYFRNQFRSQSILIQGHVLELADFKADTFTEILNFIYSSKIAVKKKETLSDLADAGKKLGIHFLENIKTSKKSAVESEEILPPPFYREQNGLKSETIDKKGDDPAIASGPRITNAFSILETEVNGFSPLDLRANFKKSTGPAAEVHDGSTCENGVCSDGEPVNTLAEHSYAVSSGDSQFKRDSVFDHGGKLANTNETESTTPCTVHAIKEATPDSAMPKKSFTPPTISQSCASSDSISCSTEQPANPSNFYSQKEDENVLTQPSPNNPPVQQPFYDAGLYPHPKRFQETFNCKNCSKGFAHFKRLQRHEQICFKMVHTERDLRLSSSHSHDIPSDAATEQNSLSYGSSSGTDHFVKIVEGKIFYVCIVCKRNYLTLSSLRRHSNVHSWRKSYPCHYCNKVFALAEYRTKHEIWHTGDRRYQCIFCLETFMTYYILKNHQKSSHGIDPRLGVGNKANNRGLKSSIYPYKLYRLLPMKCKRAPLKRSTHDSAELPGIHFQGNSTFNPASIIQNTLNPQPFSLEDQENFSRTVEEPSQSVASSTTAQDTWPYHMLPSDKDTSVLPARKCNSPTQVLDSTSKDGDNAGSPLFSEKVNNPVINTNTVAPSVIVHSSRVSSVIMHGNAVSGTTSATNGIGWNHTRAIVSPEIEDFGKGMDSEATEVRGTREEQRPDRSKVGESCQEGRDHPASSTKKNKSVICEGNKTETYIAKPALPGTLVNSGIAPLCQITVKIGSEALVKRQISGSSLFFGKSGRPKHSESRSERTWLDADDKKERSSNRLRRSESVKMEEMFDDTSDQDVSDKPWRPYYNYKPKKKSKHFKRFRKLKKRKKHSRSQSTEENVIEVETKCTSGETADENEGDEVLETEDNECPEKIDEEEMETTEWNLDSGPCFCELCQKSFRNPSTLKVHMRCHTGEKPYPCKTCGKCFSFPGNLNKHERIHLGVRNYMCQYCSKSFMLHETLKKHERIHTGEKTYDCQFCSQQFLYLCTKKNHEQKHLAERSVKGFVCVHCSKICKTAAAFGMHKKKHYLRGLKNRENKDVPPNAVEKESNVADESSSKNEFESLPPLDDCKAPLLSFTSTEVNPQNVNAASLVENVNEFGETENHFLTPPPPPLPTGLHNSVLMEAPKGWKYWKTRQYKLEESLNSDQSSLKDSTKTFTELKTMTNFETPFVP